SIEGVFQPNQTCLIIEDVVTTGSSIIETADEIEKVGLKVTDLVALIDREQGGRNTLEKKYKLHTLFSLSEILLFLLKSSLLTTAEKIIVEKFLATSSRASVL
ncbi:MAG: orotidine 5'-phosphate decarboxylase, partial [Gammaproteobacteria bacterium]|nr:orotidine 5'-phosphate decarboxylase [Gammaproteobacteria bacterium]